MRGQIVTKIWEQSDDAVVGFDPAGLIVLWNPAAERLIGYPAAEVTGKPLWQAQPEPARPWVRTLFEALQERKFFQGQGWVFQKTGERRAVAVHVEPWATEEGTPGGWIALLRDITAVLGASSAGATDPTESNLRAMLVQLQASHVVAGLAKGFTHQMSNLLTGVLSRLDLAQLEEHLPDNLRRHLQMAEQSAREAADANARLSAFLRRPQCQTTPVDLTKVVDETALLLRRCLDRRVQIIVEPAPDDLWMARARENSVVEALVNLCSLARAQMPDGGSIRIEMRNREPIALENGADGQFVEVAVSHSGAPLTPEAQAGLLSPGNTPLPWHVTALALRLIKEAAEECRGSLELESNVGGGHRLRLVLPRAAVTVSPPRAAVEPDTGLVIKRQDTGESILVADDEPSIRGLASAVLGYRGYQVTETADGRNALEKYQASHALALVDMDMPELDGWTVLREIRFRHPRARVVLMSGGMLDQEDLQRLIDYGAMGLLQKPFTNADLVEMVRLALSYDGPPGSRPLLFRGGH